MVGVATRAIAADSIAAFAAERPVQPARPDAAVMAAAFATDADGLATASAARVLATKETGPRNCFADSRHLQHHRRLVLQPGCAHGSGRHCSGNCLAGAVQK